MVAVRASGTHPEGAARVTDSALQWAAENDPKQTVNPTALIHFGTSILGS